MLNWARGGSISYPCGFDSNYLPYQRCHVQLHEQRWTPPPYLLSTHGDNLHTNTKGGKKSHFKKILNANTQMCIYCGTIVSVQQDIAYFILINNTSTIRWWVSLTRHHAVEGDGTLANEILSNGVVVPHEETYEGQLWHVDGKDQSFFPHRVETCRCIPSEIWGVKHWKVPTRVVLEVHNGRVKEMKVIQKVETSNRGRGPRK